MFSKIHHLFLLGILLSVIPIATQAQKGVVRGFVYDAKTIEPIIFTNVIIEGTTMGAATDENGFFSIVNVPAGTHSLMVTNVEFDTLRQTIEVEKGGFMSLKLYLERSDIHLNEVTVTARIQEKAEEVQISQVSVTPTQIERLPSIGGEADLAQYLQVLPGVIFTGDQGGQLYIRGGAPIHNLVLLDGMVVYNPFHSIGLFSVFETRYIRNVDVFTGGFNAEYGDRISAVIDITTKDGNKRDFSGMVAASPFQARAMLEGPIKKQGEEGGGSSYLLSAKHSYLDKTSPGVYPWVNNGDGLPYNYTDLYGKISLSSGTGSKVNLFGMFFRDSVQFTDITSFKWNSFGFGTNFVVVPGQANALIEGIFAYSNYKMLSTEADEKPRTSEVNGFNLGVDFTYFLEDGDIKYGFELVGFETDFNFFNAIGVKYNQQQFTTELGAYVKYRKVIQKKLVMEPSVRFQYYSSLGTPSLEPRLGLKYNVSNRVRLKFAGGLYSQNLISTRSDRDVVNLFNGFLSGPDEQVNTPDGDVANNKLQRAWHAIFGVEFDPTNTLEINVEPYYKRFTQLININRQKLFPSDPDFATETGDAYGIDFLFKYDYHRFYAWLAYSLAYVTRYDGEQTYPPHYDRRHNINLILSYEAGENLELSARWNFGSGFPFTQTSGFYENINFLDGISTDYTSANGDLGILYNDEELNGGRLPNYHRLDLSAKKSWEFSNSRQLDATLSVTNVYDRDNIFFFDRIRAERVNQLPILPSLGLQYIF